MPQQQSPFLEAKYGWNYGESGWNAGMDENLLKFSFIFEGLVDDVVNSLPPVSNGASYFNTTDNRFYFGVNTTWQSSPCPKFFIFKNKLTGDYYQFNGVSLDLIDSPSETNGRLTSLESTASSLGTAAFEDVDAFATQAELDVVEGAAQTYTDTLRSDLEAATGSDRVGYAHETVYSRLDDLSIRGSRPELGQVKVNELFTGDPEMGDALFSGAFAQQGIAWVEVGGVQKLFMSVVVVPGTYQTTERCRIVEYELTDSGTQINPVSYSQELNIGHGQDLSAEVVGGTVYLWTCSPTTVANTGAGKGVSKIEWKGYTTAQADVTTYLLFGAAGSGHPLEYLYQGTPCLTTDGERIILIGDWSGSQGYREVVIYDRSQVEAAGDPLTVDPAGRWKLSPPQHDDSAILQGVASDGKFLYTVSGYYNAKCWHVVQKYSLYGELVQEIPITTDREAAGLSEILNSATLGTPWRMEPEGITLRDGEILVGMWEVWRSGADIVSFRGKNYAYIGTGATVSPENQRFWVRTTKAAGGAYNSGATYNIGATVTRSKKNLWSIDRRGAVGGQLPINNAEFCEQSPAPFTPSISGETLAYRYGDTWGLKAFSENSGDSYNALSYTAGVLRVYDMRVDADNSTSIEIRMDGIAADSEATIAANGTLLLRGKTTASDGAGINLYGDTAPTNPGQVRIYAVDTLNSNALRTLSFRGSIPAFYPGADNSYSLGIGSFRWSVVYAGTGSINTSDADLKTEPEEIPEAVLRAWAKVKFCQYKFKDAVAEKGDGARWHFGVIAQQVKEAFESEGLDAFAYGLLCYDEWEAEPAEYDKEGNLLAEAVEAGSRYGIRYEEALALECAYLRSRLDAR